MPNDTRPADFDSYWQDTLNELASYPIRPEVELLPIRTADFATMHTVRLTSIGPYRLFAYLSIPSGDGPFPAIYYTPKYASVLETIPQGAPVMERSRFVTFSLGARGQRNSDQPFSAMFPGLLTEGIDSPESYVFRSIVADSARGLEFLLTRPEVDRSRVVAIGNDMALITAALARGITRVVTTPALFHDTLALAPKTSAYPLEEVNDYLRLHPGKKSAVQKTLSYFDLRWFAPSVEAKTLIMAGPPGSLLGSATLGQLAAATKGKAELHDSENSSYKDGQFAIEWVAREFGFDKAILPEVWR